MDALRSPPNRWSNSATACARCLASLAAEADVTEVLAAGGLHFVGTVDLVDDDRFVDLLAEFFTFCSIEVADPWVGAWLVPSAALARGRRSGVGLDAAVGVAEAALRRESLFFLFVPGSNHSSVVGSVARVALPLATGCLREEEGEFTSLGPSREEYWEVLVNNGAL